MGAVAMISVSDLARTGGISVRTTDLLVGDLILGHYRTSHGRLDLTKPSSLVSFVREPLRVSVIDGKRVMATRSDGQATNYTNLDESADLWIIIQTRGGSRGVPEFPNSCPRCGRPAYIGLFSISHAGGDSCPP